MKKPDEIALLGACIAAAGSKTYEAFDARKVVAEWGGPPKRGWFLIDKWKFIEWGVSIGAPWFTEIPAL